jgi:hypothetical protein
MNGFGGITFQNIPAVSSPGGLVAAAEGLTIDPLNPGTVLFGGDSANPGYFSDPFNFRIIETEGAGITLRSVYDPDWMVSFSPGGVDAANGSNSVGNYMCFAELNASYAVVGVATFPEYVNGTGPMFYLNNLQGTNNSNFELQAYDSGLDPYQDGYIMAKVGGYGLKVLGYGVPFMFSTAYTGTNTPVPDFVIDYNGAALAQFNGDKVAQSVVRIENTVAGNTEPVLEVVGDTSWVRMKATAATRTLIDMEDAGGTVRGYISWDSATNVVRVQGSNEVRVMQGTIDRIRVTGSQVNFNAPLRVGALTGAAAARLHISAQTAAANTAPLMFEASATLMTTPQDGAFEFDGTNLYFTVGGVRKIIQLI